MKRFGWVVVIVAGLVVLDQITKIIAIKALMGKPIIPFPQSWAPNDLFRFQFATNTGAFLSLFSTLPESVRAWILIGFNSVILVVVGLFLFAKHALHPGVMVALAMVLAGGIGNLIDRMFRDGKVVDFMNVGIGGGGWSLRSGIFNVADLAIVGGLVVLMLLELFRGKGPEKEKKSS
ncbi:MAG TPA: signal peptidase II [Candidatus Hydrogenedentes bacterium]|nr:signal peptidase II [Candidatus Hydrogenedentota bacterium]